MDLTQAVSGRRSIRRFRSDPVPPELVRRVIEAAFTAPVGTREECRYFLVLTGEAKARLLDEVVEPGLARLAESLQECAARDTVRYTRSLVAPLRQAPVAIAAYMELLDRDESLALPSVAAAVENLLLAAYDLGLGACWTTGATYLAEEIREHLGVADKQLVALIPLGYPAEEPRRGPRPVRAEWRGFPEALTAPPEPGPTAERPLPEWVRSDEESAGAEILIVDDSRSARDTSRRALTEAGYVVREADAEADAVDAVRERAPSLIILDAFLTTACGGDLARQFHDVAGGYVPLLLAAGAYHLEDKARALAFGADGFLGKPVRWPELLGQTRSLLRTKRLYDQVQRARADLEELIHHRNRLVDMIVHDLRSPLSGITGSIDYVLNDEDSRLDASARDLLALSLDSGNTLLGMVGDLLDVSKMSEVGLPLELETLDVREVAAAALGQLARFAAAKPVALELAVPEGLPGTRADRQKLQRVLVNLIANAAKFTPSGGKVRVTAHADPEAGTMALAVGDTGKGIPPQDRARIFELFTQVEDHSPERRQGTGLGLAFCKMAVEAHGGTITVDSEEGRGSTFTVTLPLAPEKEQRRD